MKDCGLILKKKDMEKKSEKKILQYIKDFFPMEKKMELDNIYGAIIQIIWENGQKVL